VLHLLNEHEICYSLGNSYQVLKETDKNSVKISRLEERCYGLFQLNSSSFQEGSCSTISELAEILTTCCEIYWMENPKSVCNVWILSWKML